RLPENLERLRESLIGSYHRHPWILANGTARRSAFTCARSSGGSVAQAASGATEPFALFFQEPFRPAHRIVRSTGLQSNDMGQVGIRAAHESQHPFVVHQVLPGR